MSIFIGVNPYEWKRLAEEIYSNNLLERDANFSDMYCKSFDDFGSLEPHTINFDSNSGRLYVTDMASSTGSGYQIFLDFLNV